MRVFFGSPETAHQLIINKYRCLATKNALYPNPYPEHQKVDLIGEVSLSTRHLLCLLRATYRDPHTSFMSSFSVHSTTNSKSRDPKQFYRSTEKKSAGSALRKYFRFQHGHLTTACSSHLFPQPRFSRKTTSVLELLQVHRIAAYLNNFAGY